MTRRITAARAGNEQFTLLPMSPPGDREQGKDRYRYQGGNPAVADLDESRQVERREPLPVAQWPMIATAEPGACDPHHSPA